jgi:8-oxo-dGTP pyrophosphatase MutT (NUDIX family)
MSWSRAGSVRDDVVESLPSWLLPVVHMARTIDAADITSFLPTAEVGRHSAVLLLFGEGPDGPDLLLIERAARMRAHAGQPAFPGGAVDPGDADAVDAALREAHEETALERSGVVPFGLLPDLFLPVSDFVVTPVLAWWREPSAVHAAAPDEVASVQRVPIGELVDPANRCRVRHPSGYVGMGFEVRGMLVWGFTAGIIAAILDSAGWSVPWDEHRFVSLIESEPDLEVL